MKIKSVKSGICSFVIGIFFILSSISCSQIQSGASYIGREMSGDEKPEGGISDSVNKTRKYPVGNKKLRLAILDILDEQGFIYSENQSTNTIRTDPKVITEDKGFQFVGARYWVKLFIKYSNSSVTVHARFDKQSNVTTGGNNLEFPEKENAVCKKFFSALDKKLGADSESGPQHSKSTSQTLLIQQALADAGYDPGPIDGKMGGKTRNALKQFQQDNGLKRTGRANAPTLETLGLGNGQRTASRTEDKKTPSTASRVAPASQPKPAIQRPATPPADLKQIRAAEDTQIYEKPNTFSKVLAPVPKNTSLGVLETRGAWYKVKFNDYVGFIYVDAVKETVKTEHRNSQNSSANTSGPQQEQSTKQQEPETTEREPQKIAPFSPELDNQVQQVVVKPSGPPDNTKPPIALGKAITLEDTDMLVKPDPYSDPIRSVPANTTLEVLEKQDTWYKVRLGEQVGFIFAGFLSEK